MDQLLSGMRLAAMIWLVTGAVIAATLMANRFLDPPKETRPRIAVLFVGTTSLFAAALFVWTGATGLQSSVMPGAAILALLAVFLVIVGLQMVIGVVLTPVAYPVLRYLRKPTILQDDNW
jgi:hypothetical protein